MEPLPNLGWLGTLSVGVATTVIIAWVVQSLIKNFPAMMTALKDWRGEGHKMEIEHENRLRQDALDALTRKRDAEKELDNLEAELRVLRQANRELERKVGHLEGQLAAAENTTRESLRSRDMLLESLTRATQLNQQFSQFMSSDIPTERTKEAWATFQGSLVDRRIDATDPGLDKK